MRRLSLFLAAILLTCPSFAQQALWEGKQPPTALVGPDQSVRIQVYAPQAQEVRLEGELVGESKVMQRDSLGLWSYQTPALKPDLYLYHLRIDGVRALDPGNTFVARDIASLFNYVLVDDFLSHDIPHGSLQQVWYPAQGFNNGRRMSIYLPPGYDSSRKTRFPVLYLLHGSGGDEQAWLELGRTVQILDQSIAEGKCKPMIVVMPNGNYSDDAAAGHGRKGNCQPGIPQEHRMDGVYEEHFPEIIRYVDSHYRTQADARHRAIAGLSMGGYHTYWIALNNPKQFHYVAPFSAVYHRGSMSQAPYQNELQKQSELWAEKPLVHIFIGSDDFLYDQNKQMRAHLDSLGFNYQYTESTGGHQWKNWRQYLRLWIQEIF